MEILVAVFVLATTATATTSLLINSNRASYDVRRTFQARYLAREAFETLKMIRNTNWIRFTDKNCWDITFAAKSCAKQNPDTLAVATPRNFGLVMNSAQDMNMRLAEVVDIPGGKDSFDECKKFTDPVKSYAVYENKTDDPDNAYNGVMFSTDQAPPADSVPAFCRKITLKKIYKDSIQVDITIAWKVGSTPHEEISSSYLMNY